MTHSDNCGFMYCKIWHLRLISKLMISFTIYKTDSGRDGDGLSAGEEGGE